MRPTTGCWGPSWPAGSRASTCSIVSTHAPRAGRDVSSRPISARPALFQSTRPARGATSSSCSARHCNAVSIHAPRAGRDGIALEHYDPATVSIHAPRAGRDTVDQARVAVFAVSIHAPRAGRDGRSGSTSSARGKFQSTRPARGATSSNGISGSSTTVSIHAPRAGRDPASCSQLTSSVCFNPRAPRGARPTVIDAICV